MLLNIILIVSALVIVNFLLLKFSSNRTIKSIKPNKQPIVLTPIITIEQASEELAATGS